MIYAEDNSVRIAVTHSHINLIILFLLKLQSTYHDGSPYVNTNVKIRVSYGSDPSPKSAMTLLNTGNMDASGLAKISITLPDGPSNGFYVFVSISISKMRHRWTDLL